MSASFGPPAPLVPPFATTLPSPGPNAPPQLTPQPSFLSSPGPFTPSLEPPPGPTPVFSPWPHDVLPSGHPNFWLPPSVPPTRPRLMHANSVPHNWTPNAPVSPGYLPLHMPSQPNFGPGASPGRARQMSAPMHAQVSMRSSTVSLKNPLGTANVYIRLLPPHTRDHDLHQLGSEFGQVRSVRVMLEDNPPSASSQDSSPTPSRHGHPAPDLSSDTPEPACKGCGFILFASRDEAGVAIRVLNERGFECSFARGDSPSLRLRQLSDVESTNLYLANLPIEMDEVGVAGLLEPWAEVVSVRLLRMNDALPSGTRGDRGQSKGIGFARVARREDALVVIDRLNNTTLAPATAPLKVRFADTPGQKQLKAELTAARERTSFGYKPPLSPLSPRTSYSPTFPPSPTSPVGGYHGSSQLSHSPGQLPPRFLEARFSPPRKTSGLPGPAQPVAHKPQPLSTTARAMRASSMGLQLDIPPVLSAGVEAHEEGEGQWGARPDSPPLTPRSAEASPASGGASAGRGRGRGAAELWSAGGKPKSAEPVKTTFSVEETEVSEASGEVRDQVAGELRRMGKGGGKREMYAARRSLP